MEVWKDVKGYEGLYQISNLGRVMSLKRSIKQPNSGRIRTINKKIRKAFISNTGYELVGLSKEGKAKAFSVHRLVALSFIENPNNHKCVNHLNGVKTDNCLYNLEWCSHKENTHHSVQVLGNRLTPKLKPIILFDLNDNKLKEFESTKQASEELGIFAASISAVLRGKRKKAYNYKFKFKEQ